MEGMEEMEGMEGREGASTRGKRAWPRELLATWFACFHVRRESSRENLALRLVCPLLMLRLPGQVERGRPRSGARVHAVGLRWRCSFSIVCRAHSRPPGGDEAKTASETRGQLRSITSAGCRSAFPLPMVHHKSFTCVPERLYRSSSERPLLS